MDFTLFFLLLVIVLCAVAASAAIVYTYKLFQKHWDNTVNFITSTMRQLNRQNNKAADNRLQVTQSEKLSKNVIANYVEYTGSSNYVSMTLSEYHNSIAYKTFISELKSLFEVDDNEGKSLCNLKGDACNTILPMRCPASGETIMISFQEHNTNAFVNHDNNKPRFKSESLNLKKLYNNYDIRVITNLEVVMPKSMEGVRHEDIKLLSRIIDNHSLETIKYEKKKSSKITTFRITSDKEGNLNIRPTTQPMEITPNINLAYEPVSIEFDGEKRDIKMSDAVRLSSEFAIKGMSTFIFGKMGTGKTRLMEYIQNHLQENYVGVRILVLTASVLENLKSPNGLQSLVESFKDDYMDDVVNVICIDEAEEALTSDHNGIHSSTSSMLLQMMDGSLQKLLGCSIIAVFNAEPHQLNKNLFRRGRVGIQMNCTPLTKERAEKFVKQYRMEKPHLRFSKKMFETLVSEDNVDVSGTVYAPAGTITLADLTKGCFTEPAVQDLLLEAFRNAGTPDKVEEVIPLESLDAKLPGNAKQDEDLTRGYDPNDTSLTAKYKSSPPETKTVQQGGVPKRPVDPTPKEESPKPSIAKHKARKKKNKKRR